MAQATNSAEGEIVLSGDLTGDAYNPELRATGVTPGIYNVTQRLSVDSKGRIIAVGAAANTTEINTAIGDATSSDKGVFSVGNNIAVSAGEISIPVATTSTLGVARSGTMDVSSTGEVTVNLNNIPSASDSTRGIIGVGANLTIDNDGILSGLSFTDATDTVKGFVSIGDNFTLGENSLISIPVATNSVKGVFNTQNNLIVTSGEVKISPATSSILGIAYVPTANGLSITDGAVSYVYPDATTLSKGIAYFNSTQFDTLSGIVSLSTATTSKKGFISITPNSGFSISSGALSGAAPSSTTPGVIQPGAGFSVVSGALSTQIATNAIKGVFSVDSTKFNISAGNVTAILANGTSTGVISIPTANGLSVSAGNLSFDGRFATTTQYGIVRVPADSNFTISDGSLSANLAINGGGLGGLGLARVAPSSSTNPLVLSSGALSVLKATDNQVGVARVSTANGLSIDANADISLALADGTTTFGVVRSGNTSNIAISNGVIDVGSNIAKVGAISVFTALNYHLPQNYIASVVGPNWTIPWTDIGIGGFCIVTLDSNLTFSNPSTSRAGCIRTFILIQDSVGNRTVSFGPNYKLSSEASNTVSLAPNAITIMNCICVTTDVFLVTLSNNFI